jgi:hypothetical protein
MWESVAKGTVDRLTSGGWTANFVIGLVFLLVAPIVSHLMHRPKVAIVSFAVGATLLIWVAAVAAYRSVPVEPVESVDSEPPRVEQNKPGLTKEVEVAKPETAPAVAPVFKASEKPTTQSTSVTNSPGAAVYQAGRDLIVQSAPTTQGLAQLRSIVLESRLTCVPAEGAELPPDEVPFLPAGDANAYLSGPAGRQRLLFSSPVRFRKLANGRVVVINRFSLDPASDLVGRPLSEVAGYREVLIPVVTIVYGAAFSKFTLFEVSLSVNGGDPSFAQWEYDEPFRQGMVFSVPLGLSRQARK